MDTDARVELANAFLRIWNRGAAYSETRSQPETAFENGIRYTYPTRETPFGANCPWVCSPTTALDFTEQFAPGIGPAPVATSMMGVNGLYDMGINVWEWTENEDISSKGTRDASRWYGAAPMKSAHLPTKRRHMAVVYIGFRFVGDS